MSYGFRFFLIRQDGEPADPGTLVTAFPNWKIVDESQRASFMSEACRSTRRRAR